jgi:hypothetical protein
MLKINKVILIWKTCVSSAPPCTKAHQWLSTLLLSHVTHKQNDLVTNLKCLWLLINYCLHQKWVLLNGISRAEDITSHFVGLHHDTTQHNTDSAHHTLSHIYVTETHQFRTPHSSHYTVHVWNYTGNTQLCNSVFSDNRNRPVHLTQTANCEVTRTETNLQNIHMHLKQVTMH